MAGRAVARRHAPQPVGHAPDRTHGLGAAQTQHRLPGRMPHTAGRNALARRGGHGTAHGSGIAAPARRKGVRRSAACRGQNDAARGARRLQAALGELEFTHNNLKEANLRWHRGRFVPIRYYDARIGAAEPGTADRGGIRRPPAQDRRGTRAPARRPTTSRCPTTRCAV